MRGKFFDFASNYLLTDKKIIEKIAFLQNFSCMQEKNDRYYFLLYDSFP